MTKGLRISFAIDDPVVHKGHHFVTIKTYEHNAKEPSSRGLILEKLTISEGRMSAR